MKIFNNSCKSNHDEILSDKEFHKILKYTNPFSNTIFPNNATSIQDKEFALQWTRTLEQKLEIDIKKQENNTNILLLSEKAKNKSQKFCDLITKEEEYKTAMKAKHKKEIIKEYDEYLEQYEAGTLIHTVENTKKPGTLYWRIRGMLDIYFPAEKDVRISTEKYYTHKQLLDGLSTRKSRYHPFVYNFDEINKTFQIIVQGLKYEQWLKSQHVYNKEDGKNENNNPISSTPLFEKSSIPNQTEFSFSSTTSCPINRKQELDRIIRERKIQLDERLKVYLELEPQKKEFHEAEYQKTLNSELQEYYRLLKECEQKEDTRRGKQRIIQGTCPISIDHNNNENRPGKYPRIEQGRQNEEFKPGPSKASVMGHHENSNPFRDEQQININVDDNTIASSSSPVEVHNTIQYPDFSEKTYDGLNSYVHTLENQYQKEKKEKEKLIQMFQQLQAEKNENHRYEREDSVSSRWSRIARSSRRGDDNYDSDNEKTSRRVGRPTSLERLENEKNNKENRSIFSFFSSDKI